VRDHTRLRAIAPPGITRASATDVGSWCRRPAFDSRKGLTRQQNAATRPRQAMPRPPLSLVVAIQLVAGIMRYPLTRLPARASEERGMQNRRPRCRHAACPRRGEVFRITDGADFDGGRAVQSSVNKAPHPPSHDSGGTSEETRNRPVSATCAPPAGPCRTLQQAHISNRSWLPESALATAFQLFQ